MYINIHYNNIKKILEIKENISCFHLKEIIKKNINYNNCDIIILHNNKILSDGNYITNKYKNIFLKLKRNGGSVLINPSNSVFITAILAVIFTITAYIYHNYYLYGLTIKAIKSNKEEEDKSILTQDISNVFPFTENVFSNGRLEFFEQSKYDNSTKTIKSKGVCPKKLFGGNAFYEIKKGDSSTIGRLTFAIFMCFYFLAFFTCAFSIISKVRCKKPSGILIGISIVMMIIPLILIFVLPFMDNVFIAILRGIKKIVDWYYRKILKREKGPMRDFMPKEMRNYSLMIGNIILVILLCFLYFSHIKVISPFIIIILGILFFFTYFIVRNETLTEIVSKISLIVSKFLRPGFTIDESYRDCFSLYRGVFSFVIICFCVAVSILVLTDFKLWKCASILVCFIPGTLKSGSFNESGYQSCR